MDFGCIGKETKIKTVKCKRRGESVAAFLSSKVEGENQLLFSQL